MPPIVAKSRLGVWPPLPPDAYLRRRPGPLPFPLEDGRCRLYSLGRAALWHGLQALGLGAGDQVLAPAYHHGCEIEALTRLGIGCRFYEATETLEPDEAELESLLDPRVRALHLVHYAGFPQPVARWRAWCDARGLLLIEDAAQSWLASSGGVPVGSLGELAIHSLYKTVGVPDGGSLVCSPAPPAPSREAGLALGGLVRRHGAWLAQRAGVVGRLDRQARPYDPQRDFELLGIGTRPSRATRFLLPRLVRPDTAERRREHYRFLLERLGARVPPPYATLPEGASPLLFPIDTGDKRRVLERLRQHGIDGLDLWSAPHPALPTERFPQAARRRARTIGLPVHQELRRRDLETIVAAVLDADNGRVGAR
jgi:dTDP-4-amino-4,6-dideoxygalactose transaminase